MPTITTGRTVLEGVTSAPKPAKEIKASTGMNISKVQAPEAGQSDIKEETPAGAVTLSPQLTALARKQQKLQSEIQAQRDKEAEWVKKEADFVPKTAFKTKLQANVADALKDLGTNYEELTSLMLAQQQGADPVQELKAEFQQLKKSQEESVNKQYDATLKQYKAETVSLVSSDPKTFHFINKGNHHDAVVQHIVETWEENPEKVLTVEQAAKDIEEFLREDAKEKAAALKELEPPEEEETKPAAKTLPPPKAATRTLTNQVESAPSRTHNQFQYLSMKERIEQAISRAQK